MVFQFTLKQSNNIMMPIYSLATFLFMVQMKSYICKSLELCLQDRKIYKLTLNILGNKSIVELTTVRKISQA